MSDSLRDIARIYEENVLSEDYPRSIGLFPIPEYPEHEPERGMWSAALEAILTTLRYLAPATLLTLFWGQQSFLFKLIKHIDSAFRAIVFSSEEQKTSVLQWLSDVGPVKVESLDAVWRHGWIICGVLDATLPGACAGHPPSTLSLKHAQSIADHYLGVEPVFSRQELDSNDTLSKHQEWKLATYLDRIREALTKITPPVSKPGSQRTSPDAAQFTIDYVARGSGLSVAQVNNTMSFKVYPTAQQCLDPGEITILIRGPKDTYGMAVLPPILGKAQLIRQKLLGLQTKQNYTENALPITQGARYLRSYGKNDMNKTYYIPKTKYDIEIEDELRPDHLKISYIVPHEGRYEIYITSRGQNIVGSPFKVTTHNIISILEKDNFRLEDGEEIDIVDIKSDRKVVLRIVDFVTEKMLLRENGSLEKITDDEAKILMTTDDNEAKIFDVMEACNDAPNPCEFETELLRRKEIRYKFNKFAQKVITANKVCKIWYNLLAEKQLNMSKKTNTNINRPRKQKDIPDIVNSTLSDNKVEPYIITRSHDKFIIPENISVSILTEKREPNHIEKATKDLIQSDMVLCNMNDETCSQDSLEYYKPIVDKEIGYSVHSNAAPSSSNPFLNDVYEQHYKTEKDLGAFVTSEYETNNSQDEETRDTSITIVIDNSSISPISNNPFKEPNLIELERPKSPVFKIISGELKSREVTNELGNEFINPFFIHQHHCELDSLPTADFIIGAPVSLPPIIRASSPVPEMESLVITRPEDAKEDKNLQDSVDDDSLSVFSTPLHTHLSKTKDSHRIDNNTSANSMYHSLDSNIIDNIDDPNYSSNTNQTDTIQTIRNITPKKEIWDSAYVSIDDNNSSPDSNNNDNTSLCEVVNKQRSSPRDENYGLRHEDVINMGPAEREIWKTCSELKDNILTGHEDLKSSKLDLKRCMFTPIIEESDRSLSSGVRDITKSELTTKQVESDLVTVAFAELNDVYQEYFPNPDTDSIIKKLDECHQRKVDIVDGNDKKCVDSASDINADVKRHTHESEGKISEVQANVTESLSVSQYLHKNIFQELMHDNKNETQFGNRKETNIVLERKKYWDEKIRQIEAKTVEATARQKKRRLSSKHLRNNDSLTKRRGKQIVKNFLKAEQPQENNTYAKSSNTKDSAIISQELYKYQDPIETKRAEIKLVDKWKKYWDNKLEAEHNEIDTLPCFRAKSPKNNLEISPQSIKSNSNDVIQIENEGDSKSRLSMPVKQELPEEVYKAFETSPKRFFGTSRKQILSKIDTFLGNPSTVHKSTADVIGASQDSGLVSSRISLFHKISNTEEITWSRRKCQSMLNIYQRKDSERSVTSSEKELEAIKSRNIQTEVFSSIEQLKEEINEINTQSPRVPIDNKLTLKQKRAVMGQNTFNKSFDETTIHQELDELGKETACVNKTLSNLSKESQQETHKKSNELRRTSISKSEMDIFNKTMHTTTADDLDKYKSCDELPKINVKNFISLYETVSKAADQSKTVVKSSRLSLGSQKQLQNIGSPQGSITSCRSPSIFQNLPNKSIQGSSASSDSFNIDSSDTKETDSIQPESTPVQEKDTTYLSLSDIELEIVEISQDKPVDSSPVTDPGTVTKDYKSRFKMAKEFFQSLEELTEENRPLKLNECQLLLQNKSTESLENGRPKRRTKKKIKSHSMPSSEIAKIWNQMQDHEESNNKLVKISEKFNVDDLFNDVMEGKLSRQGSLRGIPHKKAVLEAFRSMENISDRTISPYEMAISQMNDVTKENQIKNAQTYLSEYPYLPTTDPSKYHSRLDVKASGLISLKELLGKKPRRNSVPDLRLNASFTADL